MSKKCPGSGLLFMHLQLAFQRDGVHACYDVLSEDINNKPRVTKNKKVVIAKQKNRNTHSAIYSRGGGGGEGYNLKFFKKILTNIMPNS